jgi:hypothetical protein
MEKQTERTLNYRKRKSKDSSRFTAQTEQSLRAKRRDFVIAGTGSAWIDRDSPVWIKRGVVTVYTSNYTAKYRDRRTVSIVEPMRIPRYI